MDRAIIQSASSSSSTDYWVLVKRIAARKSVVFPTVMLDSNRNRIMGKKAVLKHAQSYYSSIASHEDEKAKSFLDAPSETPGMT